MSGKAFANDSRSVISFFEGRLRFLDGVVRFSILEMRAERLVKRLSIFLVLLARWIFWPGLDIRGRMDGRLLLVGA
jgi:hypothetical protein